MSYGLKFFFDGYPPIDTNNLTAIYPVGSFFYSGYNGSLGDVYRSGIHPRSIPSGGRQESFLVDTNWEYPASVAESNTSLNVYVKEVRDYWNIYGITFADCVGLAGTDAYGFTFSDGGVSRVLAHPPSAPMRVVSRFTVGLPAGVAGREITFGLAELQRNLEGYQDLMIFVGVYGNGYTFDGRIVPASTSGYAAGGVVKGRLIPSSIGHGGRYYEEFELPDSPALTLYVLVASSSTNVVPSGYGAVLYNSVGNVCMSQNAVPVFARGFFQHNAVPAGGMSSVGGLNYIPANVAASPLIMYPLGGTRKDGVKYVEPSSSSMKRHEEGHFAAVLSGNTVKTIFIYGRVYEFNNTAVGFMPAGSYFNGIPYESYLYRANRVMLVDGRDYFFV